MVRRKKQREVVIFENVEQTLTKFEMIRKTSLMWVLLLILGGSLNLNAQNADSEYALLWEVTHPEQAKPSYLFGTMHVLDENIFNLPDSVFIGIQACDGFATEVAFDDAMNEVVSWFIEQAESLVHRNQ